MMSNSIYYDKCPACIQDQQNKSKLLFFMLPIFDMLNWIQKYTCFLHNRTIEEQLDGAPEGEGGGSLRAHIKG